MSAKYPRRTIALGPPFDDGTVQADPMTREDPVSLLRDFLDNYEFGDAVDARIRAALAASPADGAGVACPKCRATDIGTRWDADFYGCLHAQQTRRDWPRDGGEHLHYQCRNCTYSWVASPADGAGVERYSLEPNATDHLVPDPNGEWVRFVALEGASDA